MKKFYRLVEENRRPRKLVKEGYDTPSSLIIWDYASVKNIKEMLEGTQAMKQTLKYLTDDEIEKLLNMLGESAKKLSYSYFVEFIRYEKDEIAQMLGYEDFDEIMDR